MYLPAMQVPRYLGTWVPLLAVNRGGMYQHILFADNMLAPVPPGNSVLPPGRLSRFQGHGIEALGIDPVYYLSPVNLPGAKHT